MCPMGVKIVQRTIYVVKGLGIGSTLKSAFDDALLKAGIENFNLIPLSSVIPPDTELVIAETGYPKHIIPGTMQPVVMASISSKETGEKLSAGVGWRQSPNNGGIFVEVSNKLPVHLTKKELIDGVAEISGHRPWNWVDIGHIVTGEIVVPHGKCASIVVAAIYDFVNVWGLVIPKGYEK